VGGKSIPKPSFLDECKYLGAFNSQKRWRSKDHDRLYTWDSLHGEIEVFDKRGIHLGVKNPEGISIKQAKKGRRINV
jgi:hypothetical protein